MAAGGLSLHPEWGACGIYYHFFTPLVASCALDSVLGYLAYLHWAKSIGRL